jgi:CDP-diglyceride synthetase
MRVELRNRLIFGFAIGGLTLAGLAHDLARGSHLAVLALGLVGAIAGCREFAALARAHAAHVRLAPMVVVCVALVLEAHVHGATTAFIGHELPSGTAGLPLISLILGLGLLWTVLAQMFRYATETFFANVGSTLFGMIYLGVSLNLLERLALTDTADNPYRGTQLVLLFLVATKFGDIGAYFGGRAFGRHKMAPRISPGKTWEGFAFSFVGSIGGTWLFTAILAATCAHQPFASWWQPAAWALALGPLGVAGDLAESCMKRDAAVKDSGAVVPGFGGFLDILDAIILAAPAAYLLALVL